MANQFVRLPLAGSGSVTSVGLSAPASLLSVSGSPVTSSGTLALSLVSAAANTVWCGPTSGGAGTPTYRALVQADLPNPVQIIEYDAGNSGTTLTLNFANGGAQKITMNNSCTFTFSGGTAGGSYLLRIVSGGANTITWPTMLWPAATAPTMSTTNGYVDLINLYYDGTTWYGSYATGYH